MASPSKAFSSFTGEILKTSGALIGAHSVSLMNAKKDFRRHKENEILIH